jgi:hypothetical protein
MSTDLRGLGADGTTTTQMVLMQTLALISDFWIGAAAIPFSRRYTTWRKYFGWKPFARSCVRCEILCHRYNFLPHQPHWTKMGLRHQFNKETQSHV